ncbi:MAG TPA: M20/M25/M40 family metallo-hydrolase, partial [Actinoplanes sp.]|nr:M20/M25/M40 family metallo-hydrolase [Actinoplanes sp.]
MTAAAAVATPLGATPASASAAAHSGPGGPYRPQRPDQDLVRLLSEIDSDRIEASIQRLVGFGTRHTLSSQTDPVRGIGAATDWVYQQLQASATASGGRMTVEKQTFVQPATPPRIPVDTPITNVIATLRGDVSPDRIYVVTAHLDSRVTDVLNATSDAPGADDDGSGVAALLELARVFATRHTEATIMIGIVAGEEQGLFGSAHMAAQLKAAGANIQGMFSNDIVGASRAWDGTPPDPHRVRLFVEGVPTTETAAEAATRRAIGGENDGPSRQLGRFVKSVAENDETDMTIWMIYRRDRYLRSSDHVSFLSQGYPAGRFTEPRENYDHEHQDIRVENGIQFGDLAQFCDFQYIARVAKVNGAVLWSLAQGPGTPTGVFIDTVTLTNLTTLRWLRGTEPDLAGYEIVWRDSAATDWTNVIPVGLPATTEATVDLAK